MNKFFSAVLLSFALFTQGVFAASPDEPLICSEDPPTSTPPDGGGDVCEPPPDVSDFTLIIAADEPTGIFTIPAQTTVTGDYYVIGDVLLEQGAGKNKKTILDGNLYATGDVFLENNSTITGFAYTENGVIYSNNGNNIEIIDGTCECGEPVDPPEARVCEIPGWESYPVYDGDLVLSGFVTGEYYVTGSVTLESSTVFSGRIYAEGDILVKSGAVTNGRLHTESELYLEEGSVNVGFTCPDPIIPGDDYQFDIITSPDALTCEPHPVTINITPEENYTGTITVETSTDLGEWQIGDGKGSLITVDGDLIGSAKYTFSAVDNDSVTLGLFNDIASELTVTVSGVGVGDTSVPITFRPYQLKSDIPTFTTANLPFNMTLTAVGKDPSGAGCSVIEEYTGNQNLKFWSSYITPKLADNPGPFGTDIEINQIPIAKDQTTATNQIVGFNSGVATVSVNYPDAGQIQIHARDDEGIGAPPLGGNDELQGSTSTIVNPLTLAISTISGNPAESGSYDPVTDNGFQRAAVRSHSALVDVDVFDITVKALIDCSVDPLNHCPPNSDNPAAPSFHNDVTLLPTLVFPNNASTSLGTVHSEDGANIFTKPMDSGVLTYSDLSYDEVGVLGLQATSVNYIQPSNDITASDVKEIGRFYPAYIAYDNYSYSAGCGDFSYMTEGLINDIPFAESAVTVSYVMQAKAQASAGETEQITENYQYNATNGYPIAPDANFYDSAYSKKSLVNLSERILPRSYYDQTQWQSGVYIISALKMGLQKPLTIADGPYFSVMPSDITTNDQSEYFIKLAGIDGEKLQMDAATLCTTDQCRLPADVSLSSLGDFAYGRLQAGNGHGSEYQPIRTLIEATYFNGQEFVPFERDTCTPLVDEQLSADPTLDNNNEIVVGSGKTKLTILNSPLINGKSNFEFSAPDNRGKLDYYIRLKNLSDANLYAPWLLDSGNAVTCPAETGGLKECVSGAVEFGLFRGNDRIIYRIQTFD